MNPLPKEATASHILRVAARNPLVHAAITLWRMGDMDWEQAMMYAVSVLVQKVDSLEEIALKEQSRRAPEPLIVPDRCICGHSSDKND